MAGQGVPLMRLCEHPDFDQAVLRAREHLRSRGLRPAIIEKDYYVTERQCPALCYGSFPRWDDVRARFNQLRPLL